MSSPKDASPSHRDLIIDVAVRLFGEHGYNGTTMRDIAKAVGVLPGSLYAHIDSKETLLLEIVRTGIEQFLEIEKILSRVEGTPDERLRLAIREHVAIVARNPSHTQVVFHQWRYLTEPNRSRALDMRRAYAKTYLNIVTDGVKSGDFSPDIDSRIAVFSILGALNWTPEWYSATGTLSAQEVGDRMADFLIWGLRHGRDLGQGNAPAGTDPLESLPPAAPKLKVVRRPKQS